MIRAHRGFLLLAAALGASLGLTGCAELQGSKNTYARNNRPTALYKSGVAKTTAPVEKDRPRALDEYVRGKRAVKPAPKPDDVHEAPLEPQHGAIAAPPSRNLDRAFDDGQPELIQPPKREPEAAPSTPGKGVYHVVKEGDTLTGLSRKYGVPVASIREWNTKEIADGLPPGCTVYIPGAQPHSEAPAVAPFVPLEAKPQKVASFRPQTGPPSFAWPVQGPILSRFGMRSGRLHTGVDIAADQGTPIHAAMAGKVIFSGQMNGYGNVVILDHLNGYFTVYGHNARNLVQVDRSATPRILAAGEVIARVGMTGNASRPHVHFEIRRSNDATDPLPLLKRPQPPAPIAGTRVESHRG